MGRDFRALLGAQFLGAFNDNLFKQLVLLLAAGTLFPGRDLQGFAFAIFSLPFVLFSGVAGDLSERHSKRTIIVQMKVAEIAIMALGIAALMSLNWHFLLVVLCIMGTQSAIFGPPKYGVIPEIVEPGGLVRANGNIAMTTFLAALAGQALAGPLMDAFGPQVAQPRLWMPGVVCVGLAVLGTVFAARMRPLPPLRPDLKIGKSPFGQLPATIRMLRADRGLFGMVVLYSMFWFNSALINQAINGMGLPGYLDVPADGKTELSLLLASVSVGIILGSAVAPRLARRFPLSRLVWGGGLTMLVLQCLLLLIGPVLGRHNGGSWFAGVVLCLVGVAGAVFVVPVQSYLQDAPPPGKRGQTFAVNNFMNFLCMFLAGLVYMVGVAALGPTGAQLVGAAAMLFTLWWVRRAVGAMAIGGAAVAG